MYYNNTGDDMQLVVIMMLSCCSAVAVIIAAVALFLWLRNKEGGGGGSIFSPPPDTKKTGQKLSITSDTLKKKNTDPWYIAGFGGDESTMSVKGDGIVYRLKKNSSGGQSGGMFTSNPLKKFPTDEAQLQFDVLLPESFPLKPGKNKILGGKFWGFCIGKNFKDCATGGNYNSSQGSVRMTFNAKDSLVATVYVYPPAKNSDDAWKKQGSQYKKYGDAGSKGHKLFFGKGSKMPLKHGWNSVSLYVKLNSPGKKNGIIRATVNGVTNEVKDAHLRSDSSVKLTNLKANVFLGGSGKQWEFDQDVDVTIANVHITT